MTDHPVDTSTDDYEDLAVVDVIEISLRGRVDAMSGRSLAEVAGHAVTERTYTGRALAVVRRLQNRGRLIEVAARALYEHDEGARASERHITPWADTAPDIRENYRKDLTPVVRDLLHYLTDIPKETPA